MKLCNHEGCGGKVRSRGMCGKHYEKWRLCNRAAIVSYADIRQRVLEALPATRPELQAALSCNRSTAQSWIRRLRDEGEIHISKWQRPATVGNFVAVYAAGPGKDAVCTLKPKTSASYGKRYREQARIREQVRYYTKRAVSKKNTWLGALGVSA